MDFKTVADDLKSIRKELSDNLTARGITVNDTDGPTTLARKLALLNTTNTSLDSTEIYDSTVDLNGDCVKFRDYLASQLTAKGISVNDTDGPLTLAQKVNNILLTTNIVLTTDKTTLTSSDPKAHLEAKVTDLRDNPIPNVAVEFFVNGSSLSQSLTNENGIATYDYSEVNRGTFSLTAELSPISVYNGSVSNTVSVTVETFTADIYVSPTGSDTNNGLTQATAVATISKAVSLVSTGGTIGVLSGTYTVINLGINKNLSIIGESKETTILKATDIRVFLVGAYTFNLKNVTIQNDNTSLDGVMANTNSSIINVTNCIFTNNRWAVYARGTVTVTDCTFNTNVMGIRNYGTLTASNCTFNGNTSNAVYLYSGTATLHCNTYKTSTDINYQCSEGSCP